MSIIQIKLLSSNQKQILYAIAALTALVGGTHSLVQAQNQDPLLAEVVKAIAPKIKV